MVPGEPYLHLELSDKASEALILLGELEVQISTFIVGRPTIYTTVYPEQLLVRSSQRLRLFVRWYKSKDKYVPGSFPRLLQVKLQQSVGVQWR